MPSIDSYWRLPVFVLGVVLVAYAFEVAGSLLFGVFLAATLYLVAWLMVEVSRGNPLADMTQLRRRVTGALVVGVLAYSVVIASELLLGVLVAATVVTVSWVTSPLGPVAKWFDART